MKYASNMLRRGFTLVELLVAMTITLVLVYLIMDMTNRGIYLWRAIQQDVSTASRSRMALQTISHDLESFQMGSLSNKYQWLLAKVDKRVDSGKVKDLKIPRSTRCLFFACAPDRNPAVASSMSLRGNYRQARASNMEMQGDVNAISYRLMYRDHILNLTSGSDNAFPLFSLFRQVIEPRETYEQLLGKENLEASFGRYEQDDEKNFLCENILEMSMIFNIEYSDEEADAKTGQVNYKTVSVPVISSRGGSKEIKVFSDRIEADGQTYKNARIVSANISLTVLTEEGVALVEQIRKGRRRAPKTADFFARYTRSFSRMVMVPQPL